MKIFVDANVLLDVAQRRGEFYADSREVWRWCARHPGKGFIAWHSLSVGYYVFRQGYMREFRPHLGEEAAGRQAREGAHAFVTELVDVFEVAETGSPSANLAIRYPMTDFEDALQLAAAVFAGVDIIVTRNPRHFTDSIIPVQTPRSFLDAQQIRAEEEI